MLKALKHASIEARRRLVIHWVESSDLELEHDGSATNGAADSGLKAMPICCS